MTPREAKLLEFIRDYQRTNRSVAPTLEEMTQAMSYAGRSTTHAVLVSLERQGLIARQKGVTRAITVVEDAAAALPDRDLLSRYRDLATEVARRRLVSPEHLPAMLP